MIFYTSDEHFGHKNILRICNRPFETVDEMNEAHIKNWNAKVGKNDSVYIIGDLFFKCINPETILVRLNGKKHLIIGNHDGSWMQRINVDKYFITVQLMKIISDNGCIMTLCHYPLLEFPFDKRIRSYMIHGHIHAQKDKDIWPMLQARTNILNAGVDVNHYAPVTLEELIINNNLHKERI